MPIHINNPQFQTIIFGILFTLTLLISAYIPKRELFFSSSRTRQLKGFAILAIIFSHIGYFLSDNPIFLYPFSILAGVGVNLFLFLSGFGLTISSSKNPTSTFKFYLKRLQKLFLPMWLVITFLFIADSVLLKRTYPALTILESYLGFFPSADIFNNLNSPLWYFSLIFFYYLTFPLFFWKKFTFLAPVSILAISFLLLKQPLPINSAVRDLYKLHSLSFPLGMLFALLITDQSLVSLKQGFKNLFLHSSLKYVLIILFMLVAGYTSINSDVGLGKNIEQTVSLITMFSLIFIFIAIPFEFRLLQFFGKYSYEIYLIHWPLLSRYGLAYSFLPAYLATYFYLALFLVLGYILQKISYIYVKIS